MNPNYYINSKNFQNKKTKIKQNRGDFMSRTARKRTSTEIYHVVFKGVNHEKIFEKESQKRKINLIMKEKLKDYGIEIYAYCIMPSHVHLLIKGDLNEISKFVSRSEMVYAAQYNLSQTRNGHLFQNRFYSECVENERYFWNCINYIHNNPVKAHLCERPAQYNFSSYCDYYEERELSILHEKAIQLRKKKFYCWEDFEKFSLKNEQISWFTGTEEEVKMQKSELILKELRKMADLSVFENSKGRIVRTEKTKELSEKLNMKQIEIVEEIVKYKEEKERVN